MHIRLQTFRDKHGNLRYGRTVALRRSVYDAKLGKSRLVQLGTVDRFAHELPRELRAVLTKEEIKEFREWTDHRDAEVKEAALKHGIAEFMTYAGLAAKAIDTGACIDDPDAFFDAIDVLTRSLRKRGFKRTLRPRGRPRNDEMLGPDDVITTPMTAIAQGDHLTAFSPEAEHHSTRSKKCSVVEV
ncbi:hypothetical protein ACE15N_21860 (plasmid) [Xanthomonas campestris pv. passiflorae]